MKTGISRLMALILVLGCMLLLLPASVQATPPVDDLLITATLTMTGPDSAAGRFTISSSLFDTDTGSAFEVFFMADGTIHGVKTLEGKEGNITIKFQAQTTWTSQTTGLAEGQFVIISGTGAYKRLHGVGVTSAMINLAATPPTIAADYTGKAHLD